MEKREIKFRARRKIDQEFVYGWFYMQMSEDGPVGIITSPEGTFEVDVRTVGQYTGLKDKNGVEIYEGDKVQIWRNPWKQNQFRDGKKIVEWMSESSREGWNITKQQSLEIIGNIHENPELLNTK